MLFSQSKKKYENQLIAGKLWLVLAFLMVLLGGGLLVYWSIKGKSPATPSSDQVIAGIQTQAAMTLTAQPTAASTDTPPLQFTPPTTPLPTDTAPAQNGTATPTFPPATVPGNTCNDSIYISDVTIPDGTQMAYGQSFIKTWMFQNTGTCAWDANYQLIFTSGDQMGGAATAINQSVAPGTQAQVSVSLTAPSIVGTYTGYWRLADDQGNGFGAGVFVKIVVSSSIPTSTSTATVTPTGTITVVPTGTATITPTRTITRTPTPRPTHSPTPRPTHTATPRPTRTPTAIPGAASLTGSTVFHLDPPYKLTKAGDFTRLIYGLVLDLEKIIF